ncbi:MAG: polysaccharide deacetylase family protein [Clostridia bacterium]|nr:polysaccharide deacetylase family protein [Clostridia bacterium]
MKYLTLSFDDGTIQDRRFVKLLNQYGIKSTFNLNSGLFNQRHEIVHEGIKVCHDEIAPEEVHDLYAGHEVAAHTITHPNLLKCSREEVIHQVGGDAKALEALCGYPIVGMAYPGGPFFNDDIIDTILTNTSVRYARAVGSHFTFKLPERLMEWYPTCYLHPKEYDRLMVLADEFIALETEEDALFYLWGHSFELDKFGNWDDFERFCEKIAGKSDIRYVTNREVAAIVRGE